MTHESTLTLSWRCSVSCIWMLVFIIYAGTWGEPISAWKITFQLSLIYSAFELQLVWKHLSQHFAVDTKEPFCLWEEFLPQNFCVFLIFFHFETKYYREIFIVIICLMKIINFTSLVQWFTVWLKSWKNLETIYSALFVQ